MKSVAEFLADQKLFQSSPSPLKKKSATVSKRDSNGKRQKRRKERKRKVEREQIRKEEKGKEKSWREPERERESD